MTVATRPLDHEHRDVAAGELDKNLVVLAGAGTGKTTLLIDRLTLLILGKEIPVEKIVALTFTKKAAEEMRERLENKLRDVIDGTADLDRLEARFPQTRGRWPELARKALDDIPKAQIGTIHSFAGHLLRLYPLQAGVDPKFREDQGLIEESTFDRLWAEWLESELGPSGASAAAWLSLLRRLNVADLRALAASLVSPIVDLGALRTKPDFMPLVRREAERLEALFAATPLPTRAPAFVPAIEALRSVFGLLLEKKPVSPDLVTLVDKVDKPPKDWADHASVLAELKASAKALAAVDEAFIDEALDLLVPFVRTVRDELARTGAVSFDGLLVFARNLLRDHPDVRNAVKARFAAFLVDEFQDTDPLQGEMLFYLAEAPEDSARRWQDVKLAPGRLFVVGDPKQSIYRFRGADIAAFEAFEEHMVQQGAIKSTLSDNFRSHERILTAVNRIFSLAMQEQRYLQPPYAPLRSGRNDHSADAPAVRLVRIAGEEDQKLSAEQRRRVEARMIAEWIEQNVRAGAFRYSDVALLLRSSNAFEEYLDAFRTRSIRYLAEGEKSFYRTTEVLDLLNLLSVIADPSDTLALVGVLRSPVGGLTDREILDLKVASGFDIRRTPKVHGAKVGSLYKTLAELAEFATTRPLPEVIARVFARTWLRELASTAPNGEQAAANLMKVGALAEAWSAGEPMTLADFVRRFDKYREDERDEGENPLADVKYDAVKVLTIHKAKGLEFPVVILPNLSSPPRAGSDKAGLRRDWRTGLIGLRLAGGATNAAMVLIEREDPARESAEEVRVFYVAATRAKKEMVCFLSASDREKGRFAQFLNAATPIPDVGLEEVRAEPFKFFASRAAAEPLGPAWNADALVARLRAREADRASAAGRRLLVSPTSLLGEPEKARIFDDDELTLSRDRAINVGHLCHKVLEEWDFSTAPSKAEASLKKRLARAARLYEMFPGTTETDATIADASSVLAGFFKSESYARLAAVKIIGRELPFLYPLAEGSGMRGVIDLLYEAGGKLIVADYKTNRVEADSKKKIVEHYRPQARAYQQAIEKALGRTPSVELIFLRTGETVPI